MSLSNIMKKEFATKLYAMMKSNQNIWLLTADLGYGIFDDIRKDFPDRFINYGSAEFAMLCTAVGLTLAGKVVICYSITPFLIYRGFEVIRNYIDYEKIPVILVGAGRNKDYSTLGFTHWASDDRRFMNCFYNIKKYWPENLDHLEDIINSGLPTYLNLRR